MRRVVWVLLIAALVLQPVIVEATSSSLPFEQEAVELLSQLTPEERVGQLFLVTFRGSDLKAIEDVKTLVTGRHISGVYLTARADNYVDAPNTAEQLQSLIATLQSAEYDGAQQETLEDPTTGELRKPNFIPLFVGVSPHRIGEASASTLSGLTQLPSQMAIGASWDPDLAEQVGEIQGRELRALGANLVFGPSLDILGDPRLGGSGDIGVGAFGGDPYWVSLMGRAYLQGLHAGSDGRLAVVPEHFPGLGGADRPIDEEIATVRKSLEQLQQIELVPFFAATNGVPGVDAGIADGLLMSPIRYQGLQGNIRATTRPVNLDRASFDLLMGQEAIAAWRAGGGIVVSDSLGSRAIRRFYDPLAQTFSAHIVARDAFQAGNDLLWLADFQAPGDPDASTTIRATLDFFAKKYQEDAVFAQRVDESVLRILSLKLRLYGGRFRLGDFLVTKADLEPLGSEDPVAFQVARAAATLILPPEDELQDRLGGSPKLGERVLFLTDVRPTAHCPKCAQQLVLDPSGLEQEVLSLYGPQSAGEVGGWNLTSYSLADLANYLGEPRPAAETVPVAPPEELEEPLKSADWLVFSILNTTSDVYGSNALKLLLDRRPDIVASKRVVVFAFDVPYQLDATDLSKVDAFFGLYSSSPAFVDIAARLLFLELPARGAPPVNVPGIGYDLIRALAPDPLQTITLEVVPSQDTASTPVGEEGFSVGDLVSLRTGPIVDSNGHRVPDGTPVDFVLSYPSEAVAENIPRATVSSTTKDGVAQVSFTLDRLGLISVQVVSGGASRSNILQLNVQADVPAFVTMIAPTEIPSPTPEASTTPPPTTPTAPAGGGGGDSERVRDAISLAGLWWGLVGTVGAAGAAYMAAKRGYVLKGRAERNALVAAAGGLGGFDYLALGLPGSPSLIQAGEAWASLLASLIGAAVACFLFWAWRARTEAAALDDRGQEAEREQE
jgi:beta-N-acetylhexosaminidase